LWTKNAEKLRSIFIIFSLKKEGVLKKISREKVLSRIFIKTETWAHKIEVGGVDEDLRIPFGELVGVLLNFIYFEQNLFCLRFFPIKNTSKNDYIHHFLGVHFY